MKHTKRQKIAVVGSGISGLASAWFLSQEHEVTLFEKAPRLGGHTNTLTVQTEQGDVNVDTGFIVFNRPNYPLLSAMLGHLNVETIKTEMSFSASIDQGKMEYSGNNLNTLFAQRRNLLSLAHWRMLKEILRFNRQAKSDLGRPELQALSLGEYLKKHGFDGPMKEYYLLPMAAAIWSCPVETMMLFPTSSFLRFFENHGLLNVEDRPQWETVKGGSKHYIEAVLQQADMTVKTDKGLVQVSPLNNGVELQFTDGSVQSFDHVVMASHADETYQLMHPSLQNTFSILKEFQYQPNRAYLHSDTSLMPQRKRAWASWNYLRDRTQENDTVSVTYWMNLLQSLPEETPLFVTLNPLQAPDESLTHAVIDYEHPVFDHYAMDVQTVLPKMQGERGVWFCGAYLGYGFHEDGLSSAAEIAKLWDVALPWERHHG